MVPFTAHLLVRERLPLVDLGTELGVGWEDGLVRTELGDYSQRLL